MLFRSSLEAVRKGNWKLVLPHQFRSYEGMIPGNDGFPGPYAKGITDTALYNLRRDPGERYDVHAVHPEIVNDILQLVEQARADLGDDLTQRTGKNVRKVGKIDEKD